MIIAPSGGLMEFLTLILVAYCVFSVYTWINEKIKNIKQERFNRKVARLEARKLREILVLQNRMIIQAKETELRKQRYCDYLKRLAEDPDIDKRVAIYQRMIRNSKKWGANRASKLNDKISY